MQVPMPQHANAAYAAGIRVQFIIWQAAGPGDRVCERPGSREGHSPIGRAGTETAATAEVPETVHTPGLQWQNVARRPELPAHRMHTPPPRPCTPSTPSATDEAGGTGRVCVFTQGNAAYVSHLEDQVAAETVRDCRARAGRCLCSRRMALIRQGGEGESGSGGGGGATARGKEGGGGGGGGSRGARAASCGGGSCAFSPVGGPDLCAQLPSDIASPTAHFDTHKR